MMTMRKKSFVPHVKGTLDKITKRRNGSTTSGDTTPSKFASKSNGGERIEKSGGHHGRRFPIF
jgi:hypothetical protein